MIASLGNGFLLSPLFVLAAGYIIHSAPVCRLWWSKSTGHILYFRTITAGLSCLFLCYLLVVALDKFNLSFFPLPFDSVEKTTQILPLVAFCISLILRAIGRFYVLGKSRNEIWEYELAIKTFKENSLIQLAINRININEMMAITLNNNKVYVGWPSYTPKHEDEKWLRIIPVRSGYRDEKHEIQILKNYSKIFGEDLINHEPLLIAVDTIITVQPFDDAIFDKLYRKQ